MNGEGWWPLVLFSVIGIFIWNGSLRRRNRDLEMKLRASKELERVLGMSDHRRVAFLEELEKDLEESTGLANEYLRKLRDRRSAKNRPLKQVLKDSVFFSVLGQWWYGFSFTNNGRGWGDMYLGHDHRLMETLREKHLIRDGMARQKVSDHVRAWQNSQQA